MPKIHLFGASGSGVSTLGAALGERLSIPVFDCDSYYWEPTDPPFLKATSIPDRQQALLLDLKPHESWICSGSMDSWSEPLEPLFTHLVFLYVPSEIRAERLRAREKKLWGDRILPGGDMHAEHLKFVSWAQQYDEGKLGGRSLPRHNAWLARQTAPVIKIEGAPRVDEAVERVLAFLRA